MEEGGINNQRGGAPEFSREMIGWVLSGFSWVLMGSHGFSVGIHGYSWVLSGYSDCAFWGSQEVLRQAPLLCTASAGISSSATSVASASSLSAAAREEVPA